ncbi:hypothetical protein BVX99_01380 [bacterium F16]|nr:hypothetical protein BVX99_01380 [bacterium F16]
MYWVSEGGVHRSDSDKAEPDVDSDHDKRRVKLFLVFLGGLIFIHWGRHSIAVIRSPYPDLKEGFNVSSLSLSLILNAEAGASIVLGFWVGFFCRKLGNGEVLLLGAGISAGSMPHYI